ncbi:MAG: diversity-generating retroelement protein Avd [Chloroflexi bacterium]|nr:diversity-generating retroelement protein Avd [Chloroflexota bacterium]
MKQHSPSPIFVRTYDLLLWLIPCTLKFPRSQRGALARQLQNEAFSLQRALVQAAKRDQLQADLQEADIALTNLRTYLRLSMDLKLISMGQYKHAAELVSEVGRLLGGWQKKTPQNQESRGS